MTIYDLSAMTIDGDEVRFRDFEGSVLLIVNTASCCALSPQYEGLEKLYRRHHGHGFEVLAFPCNQFLHQEPGDRGDISSFCTIRYDVTFPVFDKVEVNGPKAHPLFRLLKEQKPGLCGTQTIKWSFTKFLVNRAGRVVERFSPMATPQKIEPSIVRWV